MIIVLVIINHNVLHNPMMD